jgi:flagellar FliL protein
MRTERTTTRREDMKVPRTTDSDSPVDAGPGAGPARRRRALLVAPVIVLLAGLAFTFLKPSPAAGAAPEPSPGPIVQLEPVTMNLSGGHFLKLGLALQPTAEAGEEVSGAKALDLAITLFSGRSLEELSSRAGREKAKATLVQNVTKAYEGKVYDVYFTTFVMQ